MSVLIKVPNSIALRNFDSVFKDNKTFYDNPGPISFYFHNKYIAMHPIGLAFYAALYDFYKINKIEVTGTLNRKISSIPYLQRMKLFAAMGFADPISINEHAETGRFIPLTKIRTNTDLTTFIKEIDPILHTDRQNSRVIKHVFSELLRNVLEHAGAPEGANVCATYNKKRNKISIGISDAGIGIKKSLQISHPVDNDTNALILALTPGITGSTPRLGGNSENAGAGLFFTKCIAQTTRNHFLIYSGGSYFKLNLTPKNYLTFLNHNPKDDYGKLKSDLPSFQGTLVGIDININDNEVFNNLIEKIGTSYQLGVKKSKKDYSQRIRFT
ncbi:ATP-binding protein [Leptospira alstonii]|uniref:ATP-binding protein n=1 Tax=Leptospira alstonii TaxID=28452 RepID=UPI00077481CD|nr:ATP-binding protein [Leptospira alstonii]